MRKARYKFKHIFSLLMLLAMLVTALSGAVVVYGASDPTVIDKNKSDCSITVTKYASTSTTATKGNATGTQNDVNSIDGTYQTLKGATFKLFQIADADKVVEYYNGTSTTAYDLTKFSYDGTTAAYDNTTIDSNKIYSGTTDTNGTYTFSNLPVGIYVLKEVTAPGQITAPLAEDSLISIPMVNTETSNNNSEWMYNVYVYPKNHESRGTVELTKVDQGDQALKNVTFQLSKKEFAENDTLPGGDWTPVTQTTSNNGALTDLTLTTNENGKITLAALPSGLYGTQYKLEEVYTADTSPEGYIINSNPLYFKVNKDNTVTWNNGTGETGDCNNTNSGVSQTNGSGTNRLEITLKNEQPSLIKQVHCNDTSDSWKQDEQYRLDDEIIYRLTVDVPNNVSELDTFEITDTPQPGITDSGNSSDYTVTYEDTHTPLDSNHYTLTINNASGTNGQGFTFTLKDNGKNLVNGKRLYITYKAHMNGNAVIAKNGNVNTAKLTYSKYIGNTRTDTYVIQDETRVFTYQHQITKYKDSEADTNKLQGVEFNLLYTETGTPVDVYKVSDGEYRLWLSSDADSAKTTTLVTNSNGTITIQGLEDGTYYLKETKTVAGYNLLSKPFAFTVNVTRNTVWDPNGIPFSSTNTKKEVKTYTSTTYGSPTGTGTGTSTIINKKGFVLPQTGSAGFLLFCVAGIVLILGGAALIFGGRKKKIR